MDDSSNQVDEQGGACASTFPSLIRRKRPVVLRKAAQHWGEQPFLQNPAARELRTAWRLHPLGATTVWEADCLFLEATVGQFLDWECSGGSLADGENPFAQFDRKTHWAYADYKHIKELTDDWEKALEHLIDWSALGCNKTVADSTVWLGTEGSHTPLHHDTYGVNLVAQLHGRKKWTLYSPDDTARLYPTRVPYEESSVFSLIDARAPDIDRFPHLANAHPFSVSLEAGDVLYVPKHWWHFVEGLETSLSVNVWVDAPDDAKDRAKEALARVLVTSLAGGLDAEVGKIWLNPTEESVWPLEETLQVAHLAFRDLETQTETRCHGDDGQAKAEKGGAFTVRAMVDAVTAPDVLSIVMERLLEGRRVDSPVRNIQPSSI